ncbi:MAG: DUF805 domain-containing protein [Acidobacteria bacterium]|nr:DUF805 domain-containing protein [Acidobacteriota bacterium]
MNLDLYMNVDHLFTGRLNRTHYFFGLLLAIAIVFISVLFFLFLKSLEGGFFDTPEGTVFNLLLLALWYVCFAVFVFSLYIKRIHDIGYSGWFSLIYFIPILNFAGGLLLLFKSGTKGRNKYGKAD